MGQRRYATLTRFEIVYSSVLFKIKKLNPFDQGLNLYDLCLDAVNRKGGEINDNWFYKKIISYICLLKYIYVFKCRCLYILYLCMITIIMLRLS